MGWHFRELTVGEKTREPIQGEFFSTDAIRNHADALVRESIQNSLDAAIKGADGKPADTIRVRLLIAQGPHPSPRPRP